MSDANSVSTPFEIGTKLLPRKPDEPAKENTEYRQQIGALLFANTCTRPDMMVAVNICARFVEDPSQKHYGAVKRILRYLKGTQDVGLNYIRDNTSDVTITAYCDSDFSGDVVDSKSTTGYVIKIGHCLVSWRTTKQKCISTSTVEAEYIAACTASKELIWVKRLVEEILGGKLKVKPTLYIDNNGALCLANNDAMSEKTKHIRYTNHFVKECVNSGVFELKHIATQLNHADMMTKPLPRAVFSSHCEALGIGPNICDS
jgi:hypothetical protein